MKKILILLFITFSLLLSQTFANGDRDGDGINDDIDTENTYYDVIDNDMRQYFIYNFSQEIRKTDDGSQIGNIEALKPSNIYININNGDRNIINANDIGTSRVNAFQNDKGYYYGESENSIEIINEAKIIRYVCTQNDIDNSKYECNNLGEFSEKKFKITSNIDSDSDGVKDFDQNGNNLDREETSRDNINYICTEKDIENENDKYPDGTIITETIGYGCSDNQLGVFSQNKKNYFIDTDKDGVQDFLDNDNGTPPENIRFICTEQDIENENDRFPNGDFIEETIGYQCINNQLGVFSEVKKSYFFDSDGDDISDFLDTDDNTNPEDIRFICTEENISENAYNCIDNKLGAFFQDKKDFLTDSDNDRINDFLDTDDNTASDDIRFICTQTNIDDGKYGCNQGNLGTVSSLKKDADFDLDDLESIDNSGSFGLERGGSQSQSDLNLQTGGGGENKNISEKLKKLGENSDIKVGTTGAIGGRNALITIAEDVKNVFFYLATIYFFILILKLLFSDKTDESATNLKKGFLWVSVGVIITQAAFAFVMLLFDKGVSENLAEEFANRLIQPIIGLLEVAASFFFIIVAIYAFYKLVTANGNDEATTAAKTSIIYAIMGYIVVKFTTRIVNAIYGKVDCSESSFTDLITSGISSGRAKCLEPVQLEGFGKIIVETINWANGFIGIILVVLIVYTGAKILLSGGNEETLKTSKTSFIFIFVGILLLLINYLLLTFFLIPETPIG